MSITIINGIRRLVLPYMESHEIRPTGDDGLHLAGYCRDGIWREFHSMDEALKYANAERFADMQQREGKK